MATAMVSDSAGIGKKMLATMASRIRIRPAIRNLPMPLKSRLLTLAMVAMVKNTAPVPPAAMAIIEPPLEKPSAT